MIAMIIAGICCSEIPILSTFRWKLANLISKTVQTISLWATYPVLLLLLLLQCMFVQLVQSNGVKLGEFRHKNPQVAEAERSHSCSNAEFRMKLPFTFYQVNSYSSPRYQTEPFSMAKRVMKCHPRKLSRFWKVFRLLSTRMSGQFWSWFQNHQTPNTTSSCTLDANNLTFCIILIVYHWVSSAILKYFRMWTKQLSSNRLTWILWTSFHSSIKHNMQTNKIHAFFNHAV